MSFSMFLPVALALVMFGLGLTLTGVDLRRVARSPRAAVITLACQMLVLPVVGFGLVLGFGLPAELAVGAMLLAASPGGSSASLFSHLAGGDVALNIAVTALNSVLALATLPIVVDLSMTYFLGAGKEIGFQADKLVQVFATVLVPVALGMWVRHRFSAFAVRMAGRVKIAAVLVLAIVVTTAVVTQWTVFLTRLGGVGLWALAFCVCCLVIGYLVPRVFRVPREQAIASAMEIGIHNGVLAIAVATVVLGSPVLAIPAAVYGIVMNFPTAVAAFGFARGKGRRVGQVEPAGQG
ncbi:MULTISPECIES: bile acid:sodium symporter family protein [unclassified Crossiella]|uniref:bile acid:sodium symporter family protein n=1 Tax=unclassified Crossiella TaxID=2620835 RepID=UPI001FFF91EB|nr:MULTISPECIES: bile acid:sodium symporter family protein [unclassified Crossiella]MCK2239720.1 bile acid:sodium symporter family protein [Crossiella sp. S99.2]MCK2252415.1 bile acid:sodium symporter family protein [Crossiella sp. S99.1]